MSKFKKGDRVKVTKDFTGPEGSWLGCTGVLLRKSVLKLTPSWIVKLDKLPEDFPGTSEENEHWFNADELERITEE